MRKTFFAIAPFSVALLLASHSSNMAQAAVIQSLINEEPAELMNYGQVEGITKAFKINPKKKETAKEDEKEDKKDDKKKDEKEDKKDEKDEKDKDKKSKIENPFVKLTNDLRSDGQEGAADLMSDASDAMKDVLYKIPYMKEVLISGELAKLAFDYLVAQTPEYAKRNIKSGFNTAI